MADSLDPVTVRIKEERGVIVGVVIGPRTGRPATPPAWRESGGVKRIHGDAAWRTEAPVPVVCDEGRAGAYID